MHPTAGAGVGESACGDHARFRRRRLNVSARCQSGVPHSQPLLFTHSLPRRAQIKLRRIDGWRKIAVALRRHTHQWRHDDHPRRARGRLRPRLPSWTPFPGTSMKPETKYARSGDVHIAYQVVGNESRDLVLVPGWVSHIEYAWEEPSFANFLRRLASFCRLILLDRRGTGLS